MESTSISGVTSTYSNNNAQYNVPVGHTEGDYGVSLLSELAAIISVVQQQIPGEA